MAEGWGQQSYTCIQHGGKQGKGGWILLGRKPDIPYANYAILLEHEDLVKLHADLTQHLEVVNRPDYRAETMGQ